MEIPLLEPEREYSGEMDTYYHGFGCTSNIGRILDRGAISSPGRVEKDPDRRIIEHLYEDVLRHAGDDLTEEKLGSFEDVERYVDTHRNDFEQGGQEYTQWVLDSEVEEADSPEFMKRNIVWVSKERGEGRNHSTSDCVPGGEKPCGGYFKLKIPEECVLQFGVTGGVPGEIPLEYAEELHLENVGEEETNQIWGDFMASEYEIDFNSS